VVVGDRQEEEVASKQVSSIFWIYFLEVWF
jgi:hypothetical protein